MAGRMATSFAWMIRVQPSQPMFLCARHEMTYKCIGNRRGESSCDIGG